jgi:hypothetical protein
MTNFRGKGCIGVKKHLSLFLIAILSIFALVACSNTTQGDQPKKPAEQKEEPKEPTATEVVGKMIEKLKSQSYKMEGTIEEKMGQSSDKITITRESGSNPPVTHVKMSFTDMDLETYADDQFVYTYVPEEDKWVKIPVSAEEADASDTVKQLEKFQQLMNTLGSNKEVVKLEKANWQYILTFDLAKATNDPNVRQFASQILTSNADPQAAQEVEQALDVIKFNTLKLIYQMDEKTFEWKNYIFEIKAESGRGEMIEQTGRFNVSRLNSKVAIPEEVKKAELIQQ